MSVNVSKEPYVDTGTGAYPNPETGVTVEVDDPSVSTGAVEGPPTEVTYSGEIDLSPTGAYPNPPAEVTVSQYWPQPAKDEPAPAAVEDVAVEDEPSEPPAKPKRAAAKKKGN